MDFFHYLLKVYTNELDPVSAVILHPQEKCQILHSLCVCLATKVEKQEGCLQAPSEAEITGNRRIKLT